MELDDAHGKKVWRA